MGVVSRRWICVESMGVVVRRYMYIDYIILLIPTPIVSVLFFADESLLLFIFKMFFDLVQVFKKIKFHVLNNFFHLV